MSTIAVTIMFGDGHGGFQVSDSYAAGFDSSAIAAGDLNNDGILDLAVTASGDNDVLILTGTRNGAFSHPANYATGAREYSVATADFNGDGIPDLAVASEARGVVIQLGNGDGTFRQGGTFAAGGYVFSLTVGDFNGDGKPDLAATLACCPGPGPVSILLNNGDGTFAAPVSYAAGTHAAYVAVGDFNGDGIADLAAISSNLLPDVQGVSVLLGNGDGTFQPQVTYQTGIHTSSIVAGDFNGDGKLDLAIPGADESGKSSIAILTGNGNGTFQPPVFVPVSETPNSLAAGDLNGDGKLDLAMTFEQGVRAVGVLLGNGNGTFQAETDYLAPVEFPTSITIGDFNADSKPDLAITADNSTVMILTGNGDGTFSPVPLIFSTDYGPAWAAAADFNLDGKLDLAVATSSGMSVLLNTTPSPQ